MGKLTATLDSKGRIVIPESLRMSMHLEPGDTLFINLNEASFQVTKAINPFDALARQAVAEDKAGLTVTLEEAWRLIDAGELEGD